MGAVHRLVLEGRAPPLAAFRPSVGGTVDLNQLWEVFSGVIGEQTGTLSRHGFFAGDHRCFPLRLSLSTTELVLLGRWRGVFADNDVFDGVRAEAESGDFPTSG